jgi:16S rRNA (guanine(1405)-N(7))-methyltransferase
MTASPLDEVVGQLAASGKYAGLCQATLERIAGRALERQPRPQDAVKAAKRKLHQAFAAYLDPGAVALAERRTAELGSEPTRQAIEAAAREILRHHASSGERLDFLETFYGALWQATGAPRHVLDLACGLSPFALPFMGLGPDCRYDAIDIDTSLMAAADRFRAVFGQPGEARADDILVHPPQTAVDVVLLLKTLPCLDRQEPGTSARLLARLQARAIVVSYPVRSLGGRQKGMTQTYRASFNRLAETLGRNATELDLGGELVFVLT